jgi:hypothetical protein
MYVHAGSGLPAYSWLLARGNSNWFYENEIDRLGCSTILGGDSSPTRRRRRRLVDTVDVTTLHCCTVTRKLRKMQQRARGATSTHFLCSAQSPIPVQTLARPRRTRQGTDRRPHDGASFPSFPRRWLVSALHARMRAEPYGLWLVWVRVRAMRCDAMRCHACTRCTAPSSAFLPWIERAASSFHACLHARARKYGRASGSTQQLATHACMRPSLRPCVRVHFDVCALFTSAAPSEQCKTLSLSWPWVPMHASPA